MQMSGSSSHLQPMELDKQDDDAENLSVYFGVLTEVCPQKAKIIQKIPI